MSTNKKFSEGDVVTVLPYDEIAAKFVSGRILPSGCMFPDEMKRFCGEDYIVQRVIPRKSNVGYYVLCDSKGEPLEWSFTDEMLEHIPEAPLEMPVDGGILFDDIMNFSE